MKIFNLTEERKKRKVKFRTHVLDSAPVVSRELTDAEMELVIGGMSSQKFSDWHVKVLNERG